MRPRDFRSRWLEIRDNVLLSFFNMDCYLSVSQPGVALASGRGPGRVDDLPCLPPHAECEAESRHASSGFFRIVLLSRAPGAGRKEKVQRATEHRGGERRGEQVD